jgi:capsular exopolysaccharide synthesis family protein
MLDFGADKERASFRFQQHTEIRDRVPVSPNRPKLVLYSLLAGLLLSIGVPFLIEFLDHTVTDVEDVEHTYRARALGIVPKLEAKQLSGYPTISGGDRHLIENFRVIRTNLLSAGAGTKNPQVILVASAMPEEGKTVVSVNLALSFAQMGEKTLLVDGDLRRGRIHRIFDFRSSPGLSNVLMEKLPWREACRTTENEFLLMMPCGKHLEGVTEMVGTPAFEELVSEWRKSFQRIIIDTPPVLGLSESVMMQRLIDGVVFVIWSGRTPGRYVQSAIDLLRSNHSNIYGVVLNRLDLSGVSNYYNYYNYYYYSYNYYYSYKDQPKKLEKV